MARIESRDKHDGGRPPKPDVVTRPWNLVGVLLSCLVFAAGMVCFYIVMRSVGLEQGGSCASGGPYEIRQGQECKPGTFGYGFAGFGGTALGVLLLIWSSWRYGGPFIVTAASAGGFSAFFGGLGANFTIIGADLPKGSPTGSEFTAVGVTFIVMAALSLVVAFGTAAYTLTTKRTDISKPTAGAWLAWFGTVAAAVAIGIGMCVVVAGAVG